MHSTSRCFIAIEIPAEIQKKLSIVISNSQLTVPNGFRPVRSGMIHVTLKFLGDTTQEQVKSLQRSLDQISSISSVLDLNVRGIGVFSSWSHPRTIWAGLIGNAELINLASKVNQICIPLGFPSETRPFSPHLTLARVTEHINPQKTRQSMEQLRQYQDSDFGSFLADHLTLFHSTLAPGGSIYSPISIHQFQSKKV